MSGVKRTTFDVGGPPVSDEYSARVYQTNYPLVYRCELVCVR